MSRTFSSRKIRLFPRAPQERVPGSTDAPIAAQFTPLPEPAVALHERMEVTGSTSAEREGDAERLAHEALSRDPRVRALQLERQRERLAELRCKCLCDWGGQITVEEVPAILNIVE